MTIETEKGLMKIGKNIINLFFQPYPHKMIQKRENLLVKVTFFTYFCHSTNKKREYEHKTEKIYLTGRRNSKILV